MKEKPGYSPKLRHRKQVNKPKADEEKKQLQPDVAQAWGAVIAAITRHFVYAAILY
jgi:hypothetical protein